MRQRTIIGLCLTAGWFMPIHQAHAQPTPQVVAVLDALERAGDKISDLQTDLRFETFNTILEDRITKTGELLYKKQDPNALFLVRFDRLSQGGVTNENREWHFFDGNWYTEAREMTRQVIRREIVRPGEKINPFELGKGPFPLPFGQKKSEMLQRFDIALLPTSGNDPPGSTHLQCVPKAGEELADKYVALHLFVDEKTDLPAKIIAEQTDDNVITVWFDNLRINPGLPGSVFKLPPEAADWDTETESLPPDPE